MFAIDPLMRGNFSLDIPIEETTVWSVYQEQQPLWVVDWQQDERSNIRMEHRTRLVPAIDLYAACRCVRRRAVRACSALQVSDPTDIPNMRFSCYCWLQTRWHWGWRIVWALTFSAELSWSWIKPTRE